MNVKYKNWNKYCNFKETNYSDSFPLLQYVTLNIIRLVNLLVFIYNLPNFLPPKMELFSDVEQIGSNCSKLTELTEISHFFPNSSKF